MRQAGRYLPEYRAVRSRFTNFMEFCLTPDAATEVSLQPVHRFNLDVAIIFADILTIPHALGHTVTFTANEGPQLQHLTQPSQLDAMQSRLPEIPHVLAPVAQTIRQTRAALPAEKAVLGFSGAPWTLACYLLDNKPSQGSPQLLAFQKEHPAAFTHLLEILTNAIVSYLSMQAQAGATAIQIFDSWAATCPPALWESAVHRPLLTIIHRLRQIHPTLPVILFPRGATPQQLHALAKEMPPLTALSLSTEVDLAWASQSLQPHTALQGNLDPHLMTLPDPTPLLTAARHALTTAGAHPGYIVNLGHGLTPDARPENIAALVEFVHNHSHAS